MVFRKYSILIGLLVVTLALTAFSSPLQAPGGSIPGWVYLVVVLVISVVAALLVYWWLYGRGEKEAAPAAEPEPTVAPAVAEVSVPDDLKRIEGIGPKISSLLNEAGIVNFAQLAATDVARLEQIIEEAGLAALADPTTWPQQARLAAEGDWNALETLQDELKGGRRE